MKGIFYKITTIIELLLLIGAYIFHYFSYKKMGMARYVLYKNQILENTYQVLKLQKISIFIMLIFMILILFLYIKNREKLSKSVFIMCISTLVLVLFYSGFTLYNSVENLRAYYFISLMIGLTATIQIIKSLFRVMGKDNKKWIN